ncbi:xanthine dehydrogenase family protein subunit M [Sporosarcina sp. HYO08]|uniref:FAD binding domain-containing protein n=1 Tax=Sporosarcina sp. HYO08 TaxID=1759557 RepID=UPI00079B3C29|nr:FAD binding domain-containing protein [Sporosarcina sp. HYO08]KXH81743.1 xanthine dehydrogenase [Sporosarcina sp. HYO08]
MIPFNFDYYKPSTAYEAVATYQMAADAGKEVLYYSGGTEFITFARTNQLKADVVIDLKSIPECTVLEQNGSECVIGSAVSLNELVTFNLFPLLGETVKRIADHTSRNKITIGGNVNSRLIYREGLLPFLLADAKVKIARKEKEEIVPLADLYKQEITLEPGSFVVQFIVDHAYTTLPFSTLKKTRMSQVGYPIVTVSALKKDQDIRFAFSGVCQYPFRSFEMEKILSDGTMPEQDRIEQALSKLPGPILHDSYASAGYREFVFKNTLADTLQMMEGNQ